MTISNRKKEKLMLNEHSRDINLKEILGVVKRRLWIVILITFLATIAGYIFGNDEEVPIYQASTSLIIDSDKNYMNTLMVMIKDPIVMEKVKQNLHLSRSAESIAGQIEVTQLNDSQVIMIDVIDQDPRIAKNIANTTAEMFKLEAGNILDFYGVQLLSEAKQNDAPINEQGPNRLVLITFVFGIITGIGFIFLLDSLDETVDKDMQVEELLGVPVIGIISNMKIRSLTSKKNSRMQLKVIRGDKVGITK